MNSSRSSFTLFFVSLVLFAPCASWVRAFPFDTPAIVRSDIGHVVAVRDFDRDGRAEILVASAHSLIWLRHSSGTTFTQPASMTWAAPLLDEVVVEDMDGDGDPDVALNTTGPSQLVILRNDGGFVFTKVLESAVGASALEAGVVAGDYDNDGDMDAGIFHTVAGDTVRYITWADNDGSGAFALNPVKQNVASLDWLKAVTADFNQDGRMDLAKGLTNADVVRGTPSGVFLPWPTVTFSGSMTHMEAGDINGDNRLDLVLTSGSVATTPQRASWCRFNGAGFDAPVSIQNHTTGRVNGTHLVDVDEDGDLDAVFGDQSFYVDSANQGPVSIQWAENSGGSLLAPKVLFNAYEAVDIFSGDLDGDGDLEIVFGANSDVQFSLNTAIHRTAEFGSFRAAGSSVGIGDIYAADADNDGAGDLIWSVPDANTVNFIGGYNTLPVPYMGAITTVSQNIPGAGTVAAGDLNHDGLTDLVVAATGIGQLQTASRSSGNWVLTNIAPLPAGTQELEVADVDRDGNNDILIGHATGITLLRGNGLFSTTWTAETVVNNIGPVTKICPVQLNGIGRLELMAMTVEASPQRCRIYRYAWSPVFGLWLQPSPLWEGDSASSLLAVGDANRDGARDVFSAVTGAVNCAASSITSLSLGTPKPLPGLVGGLRCAEAADFNSDGLTDLVVAGGNSVQLSLGKSDGAFAPPVTIFSLAGANFTRLGCFDFQRDADQDILVLDETTSSVHMLYNNCGQYDLAEIGMGEIITTSASASPLALHLTFTHAGRSGDAAASIRSLRFRLLGGQLSGGSIIPGNGLTTAEASALLTSVEVYNDVGEPMNFESGTDTLVGSVGPATSIGYLTVTPSSPVHLGVGQTVRLWVMLRLSASAGSSPIRSFFIQHITDPATGGSLISHSAGSTANHRIDPMVIDEASPRILLPGALENWRMTYWGQYLGTGQAANNADADGDGIPNLMEYVMSLNPTVPGGLGHTPPVGLTLQNGEIIADLRLLNTYDSRVQLKLQATSNPASFWTDYSTRVGLGAWSGFIFPTSSQLSGGRTRWNFDGDFVTAAYTKMFFRLKADELP